MDSLDRALLLRTMQENASLERTAQLLFALATRMQTLADLQGHSFDLPLLGEGCNDGVVQAMIGTLDAQIAEHNTPAQDAA